MAYTRETIFSSALFNWQHVTLDEAHPQWSADFRVMAPSVLLPLTQCFGCQLGTHRFICDPTNVLWLAPDAPYRLRRPWAAQRSSLITLTADIAASGRASVSLKAHATLFGHHRRLQAGTVEPLQVEEALAMVLQTHRPGASSETAATHPAVERAREYIAAAPQRADTLADIAVAVHCSPFHLARSFRLRTGQSLHAYRTRLRMGLALMRVQEGEQNLSGLALDLGYSSHSHFSSMFRSHFGFPPSQIRAI
jgi:AraC family transcriptional regulator